MRVIETGDMQTQLPGSAVCLGYFDGVHRGHMALIEAARGIARREGLLVCVHALDRSPAQVLHPERMVPQLTMPEEKIRLFNEAQVDVLAITTFDAANCRSPAGFESARLSHGKTSIYTP